MTEMIPQCGSELCSCGVFPLFDIRPVSLTVSDDEELLTSIQCDVGGYLLEGSLVLACS